MGAVQTAWSPDGNWFWNGAQWNDAISPDGQWRFDGNNWVSFSGQRTPMPPPPNAIASPTSPPAASTLPSWVAASEVERLERERQERAAIAAQPVEPLPRELDWRHAGEFIEYSHTESVPFWKHGYSSLFIYLGLLWSCSPLALLYVWLTEWRLYTKVYRTVICCVFIAASITYLQRRGL
jgi:hypothetical protein